jgi:general secretion pathway protein L
MVPQAWRRAVWLDPAVLRFELSGERLAVSIRSGRRIRPLLEVALGAADRELAERSLEAVLRRLDSADYRVVVSLDAAPAMRRHLVLPRAVEPELAEILELEIERHTPHRAEDVYFFYRADRVTGAAKTLAVTLVVLPRGPVDALIERLGASGLTPATITLSDDSLMPGPALRLLTAAPRPAWNGAAGRQVRIAAGLALLLAVAAAISPLLRLKSVAADLAVTAERARQGAEATLALQAQMRQLAQGIEVVAAARAAAPSPLRVLDALSRLLPEDTWLTRLELAGGEITLHGRARDAAELIRHLEASPTVAKVAQLAPVARDRDAATFVVSLHLRTP